MKLYDWNFYALALTAGSLLLTRLAYSYLPDSWQGVPVCIGLVVYALAYPALGWAAVRAIWFAIQGNAVWWKSLLVIGVTFVQSSLTLVAFLLLMAERYNGSLHNA